MLSSQLQFVQFFSRTFLNTSGRITLLFCLITGCCSAQLLITNPVNNQVMQRDLQDSASIAVTGYCFYPYSTLTATITPETGGTDIHYAIPAAHITQGFFSFTTRLKAGSYRLEVTGTRLNHETDIALVPRFGVGEVFLVAGNSNAMGMQNLGARDASDRVVSLNDTNKYLNNENITVAQDLPMRSMEFEPIKAKSLLYPTGETSWYWGELGDMLADRFRVPVLFMNAAWAAANAANYKDAASGKDGFNIYVGKTWPNRQPYSNIKNTLRYFHATLGIRAVLWSHGENDAQLEVKEEDYFSSIKYLIDKSRTDFGVKIPWIIAENSAGLSIPRPVPAIVNAQRRLASLKDFNTFQGPNLDTVQIPRTINAHFENVSGGVQGLTLAARSWNRNLSDSLFKTVKPYLPSVFIHTGVLPSRTFPGASFTLPYRTEPIPNILAVHAELLDARGKFIDTVGTGKNGLANITLPANLPNGEYKIRITGSHPILPGSVTDIFRIDHTLKQTNFIHSLRTDMEDSEVRISWLMAVNNDIADMVVQRSTDRQVFSDLPGGRFVKTVNQSNLYTITDPIRGDKGIYYRIEYRSPDGLKSYSPVIAMFLNGEPQPLRAFPNPVSGQHFYVRSDIEGDMHFSLYDNLGHQYPIRTSKDDVIGLTSIRPVNALSAGTYILKIISEQGSYTQLIVIR
ncbi:hypothetical protein DYBT9275_00136 [Dyadobacter sp. CECT 9275]|uniref:Sialate O-acetylesterase domain-containing protein n=1 Tax=Dyadobacter helix TaxID=2822344 RepID=A0A916N261_9BACT|nr:T9SS type A sorting domain-containing protein [Dyadobacter sp. CECT 9275]CAG4988683.1 hypothetical protein DYBT9275_00136 [Dyadobacter sp. CECT 9275]